VEQGAAQPPGSILSGVVGFKAFAKDFISVIDNNKGSWVSPFYKSLEFGQLFPMDDGDNNFTFSIEVK